MKITAEITRRDIIFFSFLLTFRLPVNLYFAGVLWLAVFGLTVADEELMSGSSIPSAVVVSGFAALCGLLGGYVLTVIVTLLVARKRNGMLGMHEFTLSPAGLRETTEVNDSFHRWTGVPRIIKSRNYLVIQISAHLAHAIPRRAFASGEAYDAFCAHAIEAWEAGRAARTEDGRAAGRSGSGDQA